MEKTSANVSLMGKFENYFHGAHTPDHNYMNSTTSMCWRWLQWRPVKASPGKIESACWCLEKKQLSKYQSVCATWHTQTNSWRSWIHSYSWKMCDRLKVGSDLTWVINDMLGSQVKQTSWANNIPDFTQRSLPVVSTHWHQIYLEMNCSLPMEDWARPKYSLTQSAACIPVALTLVFTDEIEPTIYVSFDSPHLKHICIWLEILWNRSSQA